MHSSDTRCPECAARIELERVALTAFFNCPECNARICVSAAYRRAQLWIASILAAVLPILLGATWWLVLVIWLPAIMLLAGIYAYTVKYFVPPKLVRYVPMAPNGRITLTISDQHNRGTDKEGPD